MVDRVCLDVPSVPPAHLAEGMLVEERSPDPFPVRAVSSLCSRIALDAIVASHHETLMFLTVACECEVGAAWIGAGVLGVSWHPSSSNEETRIISGLSFCFREYSVSRFFYYNQLKLTEN